MITFGESLDNVLTAIRMKESEKYKELTKKLFNKHYFNICKKCSWAMLRDKQDITAASFASGALLPSNLFGIDMVRQDTNKFEFFPRDRSGIEPDETGYRYYTHVNSHTPTFTGTDGSINSGGVAFSSAALVADGTDYTDSYVKFGSEPGYYLLTSALGFSPAYYGPTLTDCTFKIQPEETMRMTLIDPAGDDITNMAVELYYWQAPQPLYNESDTVILPTGKPLELMVMIDVMGTVLKRQIATDRMRSELREAMDEEIKMNPVFGRSARPRDQHNSIFDLRPAYFGGRRGTISASNLADTYRRST